MEANARDWFSKDAIFVAVFSFLSVAPQGGKATKETTLGQGCRL